MLQVARRAAMDAAETYKGNKGGKGYDALGFWRLQCDWVWVGHKPSARTLEREASRWPHRHQLGHGQGSGKGLHGYGQGSGKGEHGYGQGPGKGFGSPQVPTPPPRPVRPQPQQVF